MDGSEVVIVVGFVLIGLPWLVLHYMTKWKTAATLTNDDESLLDELFQLAKRLDDRMDTVERLVSADNPDFQPARITSERAVDGLALSEIEQLQLLQRSKGRIGK